MDAKTFEEVLNRQFKMTWAVLVDKAKEYASDEDRLRNFKLAAGIQGVTPRQALGGMLAKHVVSIFDLVNEEVCPPRHIWDEKLTDGINYLLLLRALTEEELSTQSVPQPTAPSTTVMKVEVHPDAP